MDRKSFSDTWKLLVAAIIASHFAALDLLVPKAFTLFSLSPCGRHRGLGVPAVPFFRFSLLAASLATHIRRQGAFILGSIGHAAFL